MRATARSMSAARRLRRELSLPELLLWRLLRQTRGVLRFRRQHAVGPYVADFYCPAAKLVIEIDGAAHDQRQERDERRDAYLRWLGLHTVRISAVEVLANPDAMAEEIFRLCSGVAGSSTTQLR